MPREMAQTPGGVPMSGVAVDIEVEITTRLLVKAGLKPGMRVLDVGSGHGKVALLAWSLVGPTGRIVGVDREREHLLVARKLTEEAGLAAQIDFREADLDAGDFSPDAWGQFDAIIGRRVLMYLPDPPRTIRRLAGCLKPGGIVAFQEHDATMGPGATVPMPLHRQCYDWVWETVRREGGNLRMGFELRAVFQRAGLEIEGVHAEALLSTPEAPRAIGQVMRYLVPRMLKQGVVTEAELSVDTIERRLEEERVRADGVYLSDLAFVAWGRKPG